MKKEKTSHNLMKQKSQPSMSNNKTLLNLLKGEETDKVPFWFMRQAGRYLPEYQALRKEAGGFLKMCYTPDMAVEITLQPVRRFNMDAAILFSDILVIPHALGQKLDFVQGEGPVLEPVKNSSDFSKLSLSGLHDCLNPVYETLSRLKTSIPDHVTLIGFAGAPWTVATYMVEGHGSSDQAAAKAWAYADPAGFQKLIDLLVEATSLYLIRQIESGAEVIQIFDTWAGGLPPSQFDRWCVEPVRRIIERIRMRFPGFPVIAFPRGAGPRYVDYALKTGATGLSIDTGLPAGWAAEHLQPNVCVQGNLDPLILVAGGDLMRREATSILEALSKGRHIFNLGHGIVPQTPVEHVAELVELIKNFRRN
jgi:uroporphyrinogen decarboxylase